MLQEKILKLSLRPDDSLDWNIDPETQIFEFDIGLDLPYFPIEDELYFQAVSIGLTKFTKEIWPNFPNAKVILYRGSIDFSTFFNWTYAQEENFQNWRSSKAIQSEYHLKKMFTLEAFIHYFQMLAHKLPDELPIEIIFDVDEDQINSHTLHLLSSERLEHFIVKTNIVFDSHVGICFPSDDTCDDAMLSKIDQLISQLKTFKPVYETHLTEQWDGLDEIYVDESYMSVQGLRKLKGFKASGGLVRGF